MNMTITQIVQPLEDGDKATYSRVNVDFPLPSKLRNNLKCITPFASDSFARARLCPLASAPGYKETRYLLIL